MLRAACDVWQVVMVIEMCVVCVFLHSIDRANRLTTMNVYKCVLLAGESTYPRQRPTSGFKKEHRMCRTCVVRYLTTLYFSVTALLFILKPHIGD